MNDTVWIDQIEVLETCARIESTLAKTYRVFATAYRDDPLLSGLWASTAADEDQHERIIRAFMDQHDEQQQVILISPNRAEEGLERTEAILAAVERTAPPPVEALRLALQIEELFKEFHAENGTLNVNRRVRDLFLALNRADQYHVGAIKQALAMVERSN